MLDIFLVQYQALCNLPKGKTNRTNKKICWQWW